MEHQLSQAEIDALVRRIDRPIVLVGMMGVGKTSVGKRLSALLHMPFVDAQERCFACLPVVCGKAWQEPQVAAPLLPHRGEADGGIRFARRHPTRLGMRAAVNQSMYGLPEMSAISRSLIVERMQAIAPVVIR